MSKIKILVVDDHQIVIDGIKSMLFNNTQFEITGEALNGQEAMDKISSSPNAFDMIITDISMPLLSGTDLCKMIKQSFSDKKVLILSMYSSPPMIKEAIAAEADGFILKNSGKEELLLALHRITNDATWYSEAIMPTILGQLQKEQKAKDELSILTDREKEILSYIVKEYTSEEIANKLNISKKTVDNHRTNIFSKTDCKSTIGLVKFALKNGLE